MTSENPTFIEQAGDDWLFRMETAHVPEYLVLILRGKPTPARTATFLAILEEHDALFTDEKGRYYPMIVDLHDLPPHRSMASRQRAGWSKECGANRATWSAW